MDEFYCKSCGEYRPEDQFYYTKQKRTYRSAKCKVCYSEYEREKYLKEKEKDGGSNLVHVKPHKFADAEQKRQTYRFLEEMGWIKKPDDSWYKPGVKEEDGRWTRMSGETRKQNRINKLHKVIRDTIKKEHIPKINRPGMNKLMEMFFLEKKKLKDLADNEYGYTEASIVYYITKVYKKNYKKFQ